MSKRCFYEYHDSKWDWTRSAVSKFMNGFKRFDGTVNGKEEVYIGVYGPTQVGKTTFILSLLGIDFQVLNPLADALRGGQAKGKSATVTCTIFTKTDDTRFTIIWPSGETFICSTLPEVEQVMKRLREQVYLERDFSLMPLTIEIPEHYFNGDEVNQRVRDLSIIDLPGDDSKDESEMRHVNRVLKGYISRCKVCIIMEIASQLTGLTKLDQGIVKDWLYLPGKFRILLTRSVTNGSVMKAIEAGEIQSAEEFQALYVYELARVCETDDLRTNVYPLEFGDSWVDLKDSHPVLFEKTQQWMEKIFQDLVEDLTCIHTPEQEIKKLKSMERFILKKAEDEMMRWEIEKSRCEQKLEEMQELLYYNQNRLDEVKSTISSYKKCLHQIRAKQEPQEPEFHLPGWGDLSFSEKKFSSLQSVFHRELWDLEEQMMMYTEEINRDIQKFNLYENMNIPRMTFPDTIFDVSLNFNYVVDRYFKELTYRIDWSIALDKLDAVFQAYKNELQWGITEAVNALEEEIQKQEQVYEGFQQEYSQKKREYGELESNLAGIEEHMKQAKDEWQQDFERSRQLDLFLMESFVEQSNQYKAKLLDPQTPKEVKWLTHQYWNILKLQAEKMIAGQRDTGQRDTGQRDRHLVP